VVYRKLVNPPKKPKKEKKIEPQPKPQIKVAMVGASNTGKTASTINFISGIFQNEYNPTLEDVYRKDFILSNHKEVTLFIYDTPGNREWIITRNDYVKKADFIILFYSVTDRSSFDQLSTTITELKTLLKKDSLNGFLVANKTDIPSERKISKEEGQQLAERNGLKIFEISSLSREEITNVFSNLSLN